MLPLLCFSTLTFASATTYRLTVHAPDTVVDGADIEASANGFYLGLSEPSTYCPIGTGCPPVQGTLVHESMVSMAVEVPGGQVIYVAPSGQVRYTQAHSAYIPDGSIIGGWFNKTVVSTCRSNTHVLDFLAPDGSNVGGILLCPGTQDFMQGTGASYQLYALTRGFDASNCVRAVGLLEHRTTATVGAWQYT